VKLDQCALMTDENISREFVDYLKRAGHDVLDVTESGWAGSSDDRLMNAAWERSRVIVTHDSDFGTLAIGQSRPFLGLIYLRPGHIRAAETIATWQAVAELNLDLHPPFIMVVERSADRVHVRLRTVG
jgi:predicted nuclease of predicted toxin-antitoxin system